MNISKLKPAYFVFGVILFLGSSALCQDRFPDAGILYDHSSVSRVDITIDPDSLGIILEDGNQGSDHEFMATFKFTRGSYSETIDSVGFRLRGNTSRKSAKKSFKVSLNTFIPGQKFQGVEKINLNGEHNDPSISRAYLSWHLIREAGIPGSRSAFTELYINEEYKGLYINVEHIDEEFIDLRFGNNDGNLYKCLYPASLEYRGSDPDEYKFEQGGRRTYELKRNELEDDYTDLADFIDVLNNTNPDDFPEILEPRFNVNIYLKYLVLEVLLGHWDGYAYNQNNFYLYNNEGTKKFEFIPYDPDNTLGVDWIGRDWATRSIYSWAQNGGNERPLYKRILTNQVYRDRYSFYMNATLNSVFNSSYMDPLCDNVKALIRDAAIRDDYKEKDWTYSDNDFLNSFDQAAGGHVAYGIKPYVSQRASSALEQLDVNSIDPIITLLYANQPALSEGAKVEFLVEDDGALEEVKIWFSGADGFTEWIVANKGNGLYTSNYPGLQEAGVLKYYIEATDNEFNASRDPVSGYYTMLYGGASDVQSSTSNLLNFSIYPNPASSVLYIDLDDFEMHSYLIFDMMGRVVQEGELQAGMSEINLNLQNGLYLIKLGDDRRSANSFGTGRKFIIKQ